MPPTRRKVLAIAACLPGPLAGCVELGPSSTVVDVEVELVNQTEERHVFHVALETTAGLGEWASREVEPGARESVVWEPPDTADPVAIHGVVDDHAVRGELIGVGDGATGEICPHVVFEYGLGEEPALLENTDVRC